jgi:hypothetical protein
MIKHSSARIIYKDLCDFYSNKNKNARFQGPTPFIVRDLVNRLDALERFERHTGLEFGAMRSSFSFHRFFRILAPLNLYIHS